MRPKWNRCQRRRPSRLSRIWIARSQHRPTPVSIIRWHVPNSLSQKRRWKFHRLNAMTVTMNCAMKKFSIICPTIQMTIALRIRFYLFKRRKIATKLPIARFHFGNNLFNSYASNFFLLLLGHFFVVTINFINWNDLFFKYFL